jgi:hypothetical protein
LVKLSCFIPSKTYKNINKVIRSIKLVSASTHHLSLEIDSDETSLLDLLDLVFADVSRSSIEKEVFISSIIAGSSMFSLLQEGANNIGVVAASSFEATGVVCVDLEVVVSFVSDANFKHDFFLNKDRGLHVIELNTPFP